ncbi:MAG: hypothetical protein EBU82_14255, partial [Flavobacteriia bacterium]|nr:hypothetical protein [Flavobacteriia bacterium]
MVTLVPRTAQGTKPVITGQWHLVCQQTIVHIVITVFGKDVLVKMNQDQTKQKNPLLEKSGVKNTKTQSIAATQKGS